jgi:hypothetical protein
MQNMGINQLANMYMGNPQPLAAKVQQAQQQAKPGQIPPDLKEALALQQIQDMRQAAQNQQALQAGGPQPTVVDQLKQMIAQQQQPQGMPQGLPQGAPRQMAPQPTPQGLPQAAPQGAAPAPQQPSEERAGLPQLPSSLGQHLAGGGIIAFAGGGDEGLNMEEFDKLKQMETRYDPAVTERLNAANTRQPAMPAEALAAARQAMAEAVLKNPTTEQNAREARFATDVGPKDTSGYDRVAAELERRKSQLEGPKTGMPALMEYLQQIALAPRGVGSLTAGAMGAQKVNELQQSRDLQQFDLTKQILEQQQKKTDALREYAKEKFGIGDAAYNNLYKAKFEAAKQITHDDFEADKLAKQQISDELTRASNERMAKERNANALAVAGMPGQTERIAARIEKLRALGTPEAEAQIKQILDTHAQITGSGAAGVGAQRNRIMELKLDLATNKELLKNAESEDERREALDNIRSLQAQISEANKVPVTALPLPADATEATLKDGQIYQTGAGNGRWNAKTKTFTPVN